MIYTGPAGGAIRSSSLASLIRCSRTMAGRQIGQVIALHPLYGTPPFTFSEFHSASDTVTNAGGWADHTASADDLSWLAFIGGWLIAGGEAPNADPDNIAEGYYLTVEIKGTVAINGAPATTVFDHLVSTGKHNGATVYEYLMGNGGVYTYTLSDDGSHSSSGVKGDIGSISSAVDAATGLGSLPTGDYSTVITTAATVDHNSGILTVTTTTFFGTVVVASYTFTLSNGWAIAGIEEELDFLLEQIDLYDPAREYLMENDGTSPRVLYPTGEQVTVRHVGPTEGTALSIVIHTNGAWGWAPPQWMALNMDDITYGALNAYGEGAVAPGSGNGVYFRGLDWAMMKSQVLIPAGSWSKTFKAYEQPTKDTVTFADAHAVSPVPPNNDPGGEWLSDATYWIGGGRWYYFSRGNWITLTKVQAA